MLEKIIDSIENFIFFLKTRNPDGFWITVDEVPEDYLDDYLVLDK